jgi:TRAP-type uncharacterized transport system substrate-binding protein
MRRDREVGVMDMVMGWSGVNSPLLIVGLGALLIGLLLPWLTMGQSTDRWLRGTLVLVGLLAGAYALLRQPSAPTLSALATAAAPVGDRAAGSVGLTKTDCVTTLSTDIVKLMESELLQRSSETPASPLRDPIGLVSGSATGTYHHIGNDLVAAALRQGVPLFNNETLGSLDNLHKLAHPKENAALGFAQSDILGWLARSPDPNDRKVTGALRLVLPLYAEEVHVLARRELRTLADLAGRRVVTSSTSQGSRHTAENLLLAANVVPASLDSQQTTAEALCSVLTGDADAMVIVEGKPAKSLLSLNVLGEHAAHPLEAVHLLPLALPTHNIGYETARIDDSDYPWVRQPVDTLAVRALLMAFDFSPRLNDYQQRRCRQLHRLGRVIEQELPVLKRPNHHPKWREVDARRSVSGWQRDTCSQLGG